MEIGCQLTFKKNKEKMNYARGPGTVKNIQSLLRYNIFFIIVFTFKLNTTMNSQIKDWY